MSLGYRKDIDGLRSIAVLSVVLYHLGIDWIPGGFVGVDIFFVISGYLITGIIVREVTERRFTLWEFYSATYSANLSGAIFGAVLRCNCRRADIDAQ